MSWHRSTFKVINWKNEVVEERVHLIVYYCFSQSLSFHMLCVLLLVSRKIYDSWFIWQMSVNSILKPFIPRSFLIYKTRLDSHHIVAYGYEKSSDGLKSILKIQYLYNCWKIEMVEKQTAMKESCQHLAQCAYHFKRFFHSFFCSIAITFFLILKLLAIEIQMSY